MILPVSRALYEAPDHLQCQLALTGEYLVDTIAAADKWDQIMRAEPFLLHVIFDRFNRIRQIKRIMFCLPGFDEDNEHIKPIARRRVALRVHELTLPP